MRHFNIARKAVAILANLSLLLNSFLPFLLAIKPAYAQSVEEGIVENSPTPTPEIVITETPIVSPEPTASAETPTPTVEPIVSPEPTASAETPTPDDNQNNNPPAVNEVTPIVNGEPAESTPTVTPVVKEIEQVCLTDTDVVRNSVELDWNYNVDKDIYETREKVQLGVKYVFPQDNNVTVTFKCLPKEETLHSTLKIKRVKTSDLKLPNIENVSDYAYDITTDMRDGIFKYDITLPKLTDSTAKVSYIEKSLEEATLVPVSENEIKSIENLEQQSDLVKATDVDHFTIYITTYSNSSLNVEKSTYTQGETVYTNATNLDKNKYFRIDVINPSGTSIANSGCWKSDSDGSSHSYSYTTSTSNPTGDWKVLLTKYNKSNDCSNPSSVEETAQDTFELTSSSVTNPSLSQTCGTDVILVLDSSDSMGTNDIATVKSVGATLVNTLIPNTPTRIGVIDFDTHVIGTSLNPTNDKTAILAKINTIGHTNDTEYTNWDEALQVADNMVGSGALIVIITDGNPTTSNGSLSDLDDAIARANTIKNSGSRILTIGINSSGTSGGLNLDNLKAISGPNSVTLPPGTINNINNVDVVIGDISQLGTALVNLTNALCGGTITVNKYIDSISETNRAGTGWTYTVSGPNSYSKNLITKDGGQDNTGKVSSGSGYSIVETNIPSTHTYGSTICKDKNGNTVGSEIPNGWGSITVSDDSAITCDVVNILNRTDLSITKTDSPDPVNNNGTLTYTLTAKNETTVPAANVVVTDTLPTGFTLTSVVPSIGSCSDNTGPSIQCELGNLIGGNSATVIVVGTVSTSSASISNTAVVSTTTPETSTTNNSDTEDTVISQKGHLIVHKTTAPANDPTIFNINATSSTGGVITGGESGTVSSTKDGDYEVTAGTYSVTETLPATGWTLTSNNCSDIVVAAGRTEECTITNTKYGSLTIIKDANPNSSQSFGFTTSGNGLTNFALSDDGISGHSNIKTFNNLLPGTYSVTENSTTDWDLSGVTCSDDSDNSAINLSAGENITCTFTNVMRGAIAGHKYDDADGNIFTTGDRTAVPGWTITLVKDDVGTSTTTVTDQDGTYSFTNLIPGNYTLIESSKNGWYISGSQSLNVTLEAGEQDYHNDFFNTQFASITIYKNVDTDGDGNVDITNSADWTWDIDGAGNYKAGTPVSNLYPKTYIISEDQQNGYHITSLTCNNGVVGADNNYGAVETQSITVSSGQNLACTFTNTVNNGTLVVQKTTAPSGDDTSFLINTSGTGTVINGGLGTIKDNQDQTYTVTPGTYSVTETVPAGWSKTGDICQDVVVGAGETIYCTLTNTKFGSISGMKWEDMDGDGIKEAGDNAISGWTIKLDKDADGTTDQTTTTDDNGNYFFGNLLPGTYKVLENTPSPWNVSHPSSGINYYNSITLNAGDDLTDYDFGNYKNGQIKGYKWEDIDGDGNKEANEGVPTNQWQIKLWKEVNGVPVDQGSSVYTDPTTGAFNFGVSPGTYYLSEVDQPGWTQTYPTTELIGPITVTSGSISENNNFGNFKNISITTCKQDDRDGNITTTNDRTNVKGWTMTLYDDAVQVGTTQLTGLDGCYTWTNLGPGNYSVTEESRSGWHNLNSSSHGFGGIDSGDTSKSWTFINTRLGKVIVKKVMVGGTDSFDFTGDVNGTISTNDGTIELNNVIPGDDKTSEESEKTGWNLTDISCEGGRSMGPGLIDLANRRVIFRVESGETITCTFTNTKYSSISGYKYADQDGLLTTPDDQDPVSGWKMKLFKFDGVRYIDTNKSTTTDSNGYYIFDNLTSGLYRVIEESKTGWTPLLPTSEQIDRSLTSGQNSINNNFINSDNDKLTICHATGSDDNNPFNKITISKSAVYHAHIQHQDNEDIIPTFTYGDGQYSQNWVMNNGSNDLKNQAIYNNECNPDVTSSISGQKFLDYDGDGIKDSSESGIQGWTINLDKNADSIIDKTTTTDTNGNYTFSDLDIGVYRVTEENQSGWYQTTANPSDITLNYNSDITGINFGNFQKGSVQGCKYNDLNGNGIRANKEGTGSEPTLSGWTIRLYNSSWQKIAETVTSSNNYSNYYFNNVMSPGVYYLCEQMQSGWTQKEPLSGENYGYIAVQNQSGNTNEGALCKQITINQSGFSGSHYYSFGNQRLEPKTTITKSNNSNGVEINPGGSVEYSINVGFADNNVNNLKVTDLLSNGFKYKAGSYKVYKTSGSVTTDVTSLITEPEYHSPGVWDLTALGVLKPEDTVKLVYTADISTSQQAGKYADLAWSIANYSYDSNKTVLALAGDEGKVDNNFVGTQVVVGGSYQNSVSAEVKQENHTTGEVLGASTELPGTGAATIWLLISGLIGLAGFSLLKFNKKTMLTILLTLLSFGLIISPVRAESSNLSVRLEEPKTPSRIKEIEIKYVALDIQGRGVTVNCLKKGPTDGSFVQFSSETLSGVNGNSSHCSLTSAITDNGSYQFQVKAIAGGEETLSNIVSLDYNTSTPGTPNDYRKEQINNCDFKIHFKTADDSGKTVKVEIYRSSDPAFSANNESLVNSVSVGSNQEKDIWNNVPDCSKTYYFALRAFDNAGNGSGLVGDKVYTTVTDGTTTVTSTTTNTGAIPISGTVIPKEGEGDQVNPDTSSTDETGQVLGTKDLEKENFFAKHPLIYLLIFVVALDIIVYVVQEIKKGKKVSVKKRK